MKFKMFLRQKPSSVFREVACTSYIDRHRQKSENVLKKHDDWYLYCQEVWYPPINPNERKRLLVDAIITEWERE